MIRIAMVEDEAAVREQLMGYVQRYTRQYGGTMTVKWENSWFTVRILLPIPKKNKS